MEWERVARRQHGAVSHEQLLAAGLSRRNVQVLATTGALVRATHGVYVAAPAPEGYWSTVWVAVPATRGALAFNTAAALWELVPEPSPPITVLVPHARRVDAPPSVRIRRRSRAFVVVTRAGLPVTDRATSLFDHLSTLRGPQAGALFDRGIQRGWITEADVLGRLSARTPGNPRLRQLAESLGDRAASTLERRFHALLRAAGIRGWVANLVLDVPGDRFVLDVAFAEQRLAIELDGRAFHVDTLAFQRDRSRQNRLVGLGWRVLRFTWQDVAERPDDVVRTVRAELARRPA